MDKLQDMARYYSYEIFYLAFSGLLVEWLLGGEKKLEDLDKGSKMVKIFTKRSLRGHLAEVMPMDDHILDKILENINSQEDGKFVASSAEEKSVITRIYQHLSDIYEKIIDYLFGPPSFRSSCLRRCRHCFLFPPFPAVVSTIQLAIEKFHKMVGRICEEAEEAEEILEDSLWITDQLGEIDLKAK